MFDSTAALEANTLIGRSAQALMKKIKDLRYQNAEFQCISDYDKCVFKRGEGASICAIALIVCIARRIVPFVR
jgi:hypothetical protein